MSDPREPFTARALRDADAPEYSPGFWDRLDARLEGEGVGARAERSAARARHSSELEATDLQADPVDLRGAVAPLAPMRVRRQPRARILAVAAAVVLALVATWQVRPDGDEVQTASRPDPTAPGTAPSGSTAMVPPSSAESAVLAWLQAVGAGEINAALVLTGPRTVAYYEALGADMAGVLLESGEAYGGWTDAPDRSTSVVPLGELGGQAVAAVVVAGTWSGEGDDGYRIEAIPVVQRRGGGAWLVEPAAFDPDRGGRLELTSPPPGADGLGGIRPDGIIELASAGSGSYFFAVDGAEPVEVPASPAGGSVRFDPPGELTGGTHQLVVAQIDDRNITAQAHTFTVEG